MKYLNITDETIIYIVAPAKVATGGPELLHQLAHLLKNKLKLKVFMYYQPLVENPIHNDYLEYKVPYVDKIDDSKTNIIIVPELYEYIKILANYNNIQKVLWWLSVDFFYSSKFYNDEKIKSFLCKLNNFISNKTGLLPLIDIPSCTLKYYDKYNLANEEFINSIDLHCVQSEYAKVTLEQSGIKNITKLSDYLNEDFMKIRPNNNNKENIVAYNPKKGVKFTNALKSIASDIKFVAIENMTREEVIKLLQKSKVYIDFGNHPGKDRIPREAAILNCVVLTGKRGSAKYKDDVFIDEEFKFDESDSSFKKILEKIIYIFDNFEHENQKFDLYREKIKREKDDFLVEAQKTFVKD